MSAEARYFRVGLFVFTGLALIGACTAMLGGQALFEPSIVAETYFDESVQGLEVGSPVKFRGVKMGSVSEIGFVTDYYQFAKEEDQLRYARTVLVRMELTPREAQRDLSRARRNRLLQRQIREGLRVQLASQGITGTSFVQADVLSPESHPPMKIGWRPEEFYVPSAPSTFKQITTAAERIFEDLEDAEIDKVIANLDGLIEELRGTNTRVRRLMDGGKYDLEASLENLRVASENLRDVTDTARQYPSLMILGQPPQPAQ